MHSSRTLIILTI